MNHFRVRFEHVFCENRTAHLSCVARIEMLECVVHIVTIFLQGVEQQLVQRDKAGDL
jgi:hypothetical protein